MSFIHSVFFSKIIPTKNIFLTAHWKQHFHTSSEYHAMKNATVLFPRSRSICFFNHDSYVSQSIDSNVSQAHYLSPSTNKREANNTNNDFKDSVGNQLG